jgi:hypothetical protein
VSWRDGKFESGGVADDPHGPNFKMGEAMSMGDTFNQFNELQCTCISTDEGRRGFSLERSLQLHQDRRATTEQILHTAKAFEAYLKGESAGDNQK